MSGRAEAGRPVLGRPSAPSVLVVMGVSGCGKSTIGKQLALRLGWRFEDGDRFHPRQNIEKMQAGQPLTDEDRWPWLEAIAAWIDDTRRLDGHAIIACSALKRRYREIIVGDRPDVRLIYLKGDMPLIARRMAARHGHFMPPELLRSQFAALEEPGADERPITVSVEPTPPEIVERIVAALDLPDAAPRRAADA